ncbi:MAG TPA: tRNA pseudouridine(13) synthase TruD [Streptosporangiaceae bacterium]|nr:tRNA pseudouridine(13) synthase TruD [Streptosporangiaceae bacterium]
MGDPVILKYLPNDFLVRENLIVDLTSAAEASQQYLLLRKYGFTTMEAIRLVADRLGLTWADVTYGGLKDEDAVTEQLVAVPMDAPVDTLPAADNLSSWPLVREPDRWLELRHYGYGTEPLQIGRLEGNAFRIVVRNVEGRTAARFALERKMTSFFLNFYDTQRFGVPNGPKRTHLVGSAILEGRWDDALTELIGLRAPESRDAEDWTGPAPEFFARLDPRTVSFYLAAHASHRWNGSLSALVEETCPDEHFPIAVDGVAYRYVTSPRAATKVLAKATMLPYMKYTFVDGAPTEQRSQRTTVVQTSMTVETVTDDREIVGRSSVCLRFFLPSGSYATAAVRQVMSYGGST